MEPFCTYAVIIVTCVFSIAGFQNPALVQKHVFWPEAILGWKQYYRLFTSSLLHANGMHLGMNMFSLYFFGPLIESYYGGEQFLAIYLGAVVGGSLLSLLVHRRHDYRAYGASGGVSGIILASVFLFPGISIGIFPIPVPIPGWAYAIGFLVFSFFGMKNRLGNIGHDAHLGGALAGMFVATALHPSIAVVSPALFATVTLGTILMFLYLARNPLFLPGGAMHLWRQQPSPRTSADSDLEEYKRNERRLDAVLAKISEQGLQSLTVEEQRLLRDTSDKYKRRAIVEKPKSGLPF
jgi:membrane associated rhomboid family serine protease